MTLSKFPSPSPRLWFGLVLILIAFALIASVPASATPPAAFTTFDNTLKGCLDGVHPNGVDCNNYAAKEDVYINGGPNGLGGLNNGSYYFVVLVPGYQNGGFIYGADGNLSDDVASNDTKSDPSETGAGSGDADSNRTFTVSNGVVNYTGTHALGTDPQGDSVIQLFPYDDTTNMGGVYILAICQTGATSSSQCKYDAFRIKKTTPGGQPSTGTVTVCKFWDQNFDHQWDNDEPYIGAWPISASVTGGDTNATLDASSKDTDNTVVDGVPGPAFGCTTFTLTWPSSDTSPTAATVTFTEANAPDSSASPASQACNLGAQICQATPTSTWVQTAPWDFVNKVLVTDTASVSPNQDVQADNFGNDTGLPLTTSKDANGSYKTTYVWSIQKDVTNCTTSSGVACDSAIEAHQIGGTATFTYKVTVTHDSGTNSAIKVTGTITVNNPNLDASNNVVPVTITGVTDQLSDSTSCTVTGGGAQTLTKASTTFSYECDISGATVPTSETNTVTVSWNTQTLSNGGTLAGGSATFTSGVISFTQTLVDDSVTVTDAVTNGNCTETLGTVNINGTTTVVGTGGCPITNLASPSYGVFTYKQTFSVPSFACATYTNTATFTTDTTSTTGSDNKTVTVCGPAKTGALTMGFWQNKNGQGIISGGLSTGGVCNSGTWLRALTGTPTSAGPFDDLSATATCSQVAGYVYSVIKAATCGGSTCNAMLKAQMLATALDVYFSDPSLGGNKIGAPAPIGGVSIDLTQVCSMIDGTGGTGSCSGKYENDSAVFGGNPCQTVYQMLVYAASQSTAAGGTTWYGNMKTTQVKAKNAFDAINNQLAFACGP